MEKETGLGTNQSSPIGLVEPINAASLVKRAQNVVGCYERGFGGVRAGDLESLFRHDTRISLSSACQQIEQILRDMSELPVAARCGALKGLWECVKGHRTWVVYPMIAMGFAKALIEKGRGRGLNRRRLLAARMYAYAAEFDAPREEDRTRTQAFVDLAQKEVGTILTSSGPDWQTQKALLTALAEGTTYSSDLYMQVQGALLQHHLAASQFNVAAGYLGNLHTASLLRNGLRALPEALQPCRWVRRLGLPRMALILSDRGRLGRVAAGWLIKHYGKLPLPQENHLSHSMQEG
jgi:hypothetical protein